MKKIFLDTNVFIDYIARRENYFENAALIVQLGRNKKCELLVSSLSFATASFILQAHHKLSSDIITSLFSQFVNICHITTVDSQTIIDSLASDFKDFEDGIQHFSAKRAHADVIITRNKGDFTTSSIPVYEPKDFLDMLKTK